MASSDEDERKKRSINEMFGDDSNDEDEEDDIRPVSTSATTADASGLFGSDSESEDDDDDAARKPAKRAPSPPPAKRAKTSKGKALRRKEEAASRRSRHESGDEYDSGDEVVAGKDDEDFIDGEDDLADVLGEYDQDGQNFDDERPPPEEEEEAARRGGSNDDFFDQTLKSLKTGRARAKLNLSAQEMEQVTQEVLYRMDKAYTDDMSSIKARRPALEKIKFVDSALHVMRKVQLQPMLLDFDVLSFIKKWIQPLDDGSLPNVGVRTKMLEMVNRMPVFKEHLKRSGFGKVVMLLMKHPQETRENKELCRSMVERWSRSVFNKTLDYSKLAELEAEKADNAAYRRRLMKKKAANAKSNQTERSSGSGNVFSTRNNEDQDQKGGDPSSERAARPDELKFDFLLRPPPKVDMSNAPAKKAEVDTRKARLAKRMIEIAKPGKKSKRSVGVSIEGR